MRRLLSACALILALASHTHALPVVGYLEATAANGWQGTYAVQGSDGAVVTGAQSVSLLAAFDALPLVTTGCALSSSCTQVGDQTMTYLALNLRGSADLGDVGVLTWDTQGFRVLAGDPSPPVAVLADVTGHIGGDTLTASLYDFIFNATLTGTFVAVDGGQALSAIRLDFSTGDPPARAAGYWDGYTYIDVGVPVALGTPLAVPEPSTLFLLATGLACCAVWRWRRASCC